MGLRTALGLKKPRKDMAKTVSMKPAWADELAIEHKAVPQLAPVAPPAEFESWFAGKEFSHDWLSSKVAPWFAILEPWCDAPVKVLEVGSYEGRSAIAFLRYLPKSHITCVDTFALEDVTLKSDGSVIEQRFDRNLMPFGERVKKIKGTAATALDRMRAGGEIYDIVYLDAGKKRDWVFALSALAWPLLRVGGILMWDDLRWGRDKPDEERPESAIRLFCSAFSSCLEVMHDDRQMIVRKTAAWPVR
jgi:hypothetical protein